MLMVLESRLLKTAFAPKIREVTGAWRKLCTE